MAFSASKRRMIGRIGGSALGDWWQACMALLQKNPIREAKAYLFGEERVTVNCYQENNIFFTQAIAHLEQHGTESASGWVIDVIDETSSGICMPKWLLSRYYEVLTHHHFVVNDDSTYVLYVRFDSGRGSVQCIDKKTHHAIVWCTSQDFLPSWEGSFPFRQVLHDFFEDTPYCLIHGAGIGMHGEGVLLTAKGGAGKSTAALACLQAGWQYVGDDFILLNTKTNFMYSLYNVAKLERHQLPKFKSLCSTVRLGCRDAHKQQIFLYPEYKQKLSQKMHVKAIVIPRYDPQRLASDLSAVSRAMTLLSMAPSTLFLLRAGDALFKKLVEVCKARPAYQLTTSPFIASIPQALQELL